MFARAPAGGLEDAMTLREFYLERLKAEAPVFVKVLRALPDDKADYRPHPRSRSAAELAWMLVGEATGAIDLVNDLSLDWADSKVDGSLASAADLLERGQNELVARVASLDDAAWASETKLLMGGQVAWKAPLGEMLWGFLFDAIHHRGQLSAYIRPMGGKVPSIYGPSADDPGA
jgi:uncharacterized damage-inducible protein DinB